MKVKKLYQEWHQTENNLKGKKAIHSNTAIKVTFLFP